MAAKPKNPFRKSPGIWDRDKCIDHLCDELATSSKGVGSVIRSATAKWGDYPRYSTLMDWLDKEESYAEKYARAKEAQADFMVEEILEISDDGRNDFIESLDKDEQPMGYKLNGEHVQRSKLRVDARKWVAAKLKPKKYGDKLELGGTVELGLAERLAERRKERRGK